MHSIIVTIWHGITEGIWDHKSYGFVWNWGLLRHDFSVGCLAVQYCYSSTILSLLPSVYHHPSPSSHPPTSKFKKSSPTLLDRRKIFEMARNAVDIEKLLVLLQVINLYLLLKFWKNSLSSSDYFKFKYFKAKVICHLHVKLYYNHICPNESATKPLWYYHHIILNCSTYALYLLILNQWHV